MNNLEDNMENILNLDVVPEPQPIKKESKDTLDDRDKDYELSLIHI